MKAKKKESKSSVDDLQKVEKDPTEGSDRFPDFEYEHQPDTVREAYHVSDNKFHYISANGFLLEVQIYSKHIIRFRYAHNGQLKRDFSYALDPDKEWPFPTTTTGGNKEHYFIKTEALTCEISKENMRVRILRTDEQSVLSEDAEPVTVKTTIQKGLDTLKVTKSADPEEAYFGLGDKSGALNLRGQKLQNWNTDSFAYTKDTDPLYRSIPFYLSYKNGLAHGIFFHNTSRTIFDFDSEEKGVTSFSGNAGEIDYFFIDGPELTTVAQRYIDLTGRPELPPVWAFGYHQSRWSYFPEQRVREVAADFRKKKFPCDAIYLDIDYMDGYRCFTWNKKHFPDLAQLIQDLEKEGFQTIVMIDPGIRVDPDYWVYQEGMEKDVFCKRSSGELMIGPVWPPHCVFPDYTNPSVREWWKGLYEELYVNQGVRAFWNDMNEPAVFKVLSKTFPDNILHDFDGDPVDHRAGHNVYGQQMSRATYEGLKALQPEKRPFVLTRASFSGGQRFASLWTGDNRATWEHLRIANIQCQRLSISGYSFVGTDIGGFAGQPDGELLVRWLQLGIFHPFYRVHSMGNNLDGATEVDSDNILASEKEKRLDQEPWVYGEPYTTQARQAVEFRYQLLPYLYTSFWQHIQTGSPVIKSLLFFDQNDPSHIDRETEFLFGDHLLVRPILEAGAEAVDVKIPKGTWLEYYNGTPFQGSQLLNFKVQADQIPLFVKSGAVVPNYPVQQYVGEKTIDTVALRVYFGEEGVSQLYEDAGDGYQYQNGDYLVRTFTTTGTATKLNITQETEGNFSSDCQTFEVSIFGCPFSIEKVFVDGQSIPFSTNKNGTIQFRASAGFETISIN